MLITENSEDEHPKQKELDELLNGNLSGERLVAVLIHLEDCITCQKKLPPVETESLLKAVFGEEEPFADDSDYSSLDAKQSIS